MDVDLYQEPLGHDGNGQTVYLRDIWPTTAEVAALIESAVESEMFRTTYGEVFEGDDRWNSLDTPDGDRYAWTDDSTYVRHPPYFEGMPEEPAPLRDIAGWVAQYRLLWEERYDTLATYLDDLQKEQP